MLACSVYSDAVTFCTKARSSCLLAALCQNVSKHSFECSIQIHAACVMRCDIHYTGVGTIAERQRQGTDFEKKRLGKAVEATLEKMYEQSKFPSDENINSFLQLHRGLPRYRVVDCAFFWVTAYLICQACENLL